MKKIIDLNDPVREHIKTVARTAQQSIKTFLLRIVVHLCAIVYAAQYEGPYILCVYIGLICLIPRGYSLQYNWLLPTLAGCMQIIAGLLSGLILPIALILGGAQTWLLRCLTRRLQLGWEWSALPFIVAALSFGLPLPQQDPFPLSAALSFPIVTACGWLYYQTVVLKRLASRNRSALHKYQTVLSSALIGKKIPSELGPLCEKLQEQIDALLLLEKFYGPQEEKLAALIAGVSAEVERLQTRPNPCAWDRDAGEVAAGLHRVSAAIHDYLHSAHNTDSMHNKQQAGSLSKSDSRTGTTSAQSTWSGKKKSASETHAQKIFSAACATKIENFQKEIYSLGKKKKELPQALQPSIDNICDSAHNILKCMCADKADLIPGEKFLNRYLPAAHKVVDEYIRLEKDAEQHKNIASVLERSADLLVRLAQAFKDEHGSLLDNDAVNLTAELNVLDALLKMDGK